MSQTTKVVVDQIIKCAEMNMSQGEIADLLYISNSTVHRITKKLGIILARKVRNGKSNEIYTEAGESELFNAERAKRIGEAKLVAAARGADRAAREAEINFNRSSEGRLKAKLVGVTSKRDRFEITYGHCLNEFENLQHKLGKRGQFPNTEPRPRTMHKGAAEIAQRRKENAVEQGNRIMARLANDRIVSAAEAAQMIGDSAPKTSNYLIKLFQSGQLHRARDYILIKGQPKKQWRWVFSKQPITPKYNFEDER